MTESYVGARITQAVVKRPSRHLTYLSLVSGIKDFILLATLLLLLLHIYHLLQ